MMNFTQNDLKNTAEKILEMHPDPVPRFRLLRDVLRLNQAEAAYQAAEKGVQRSKWIALLRDSKRQFP